MSLTNKQEFNKFARRSVSNLRADQHPKAQQQ